MALKMTFFCGNCPVVSYTQIGASEVLMLLIITVVRLQVLTTLSMKMTAVWDIAPCNAVEADRSFRGAYYLHHSPDVNNKNF
jgi:hypothetical protein